MPAHRGVLAHTKDGLLASESVGRGGASHQSENGSLVGRRCSPMTRIVSDIGEKVGHGGGGASVGRNGKVKGERE